MPFEHDLFLDQRRLRQRNQQQRQRQLQRPTLTHIVLACCSRNRRKTKSIRRTQFNLQINNSNLFQPQAPRRQAHRIHAVILQKFAKLKMLFLEVTQPHQTKLQHLFPPWPRLKLKRKRCRLLLHVLLVVRHHNRLLIVSNKNNSFATKMRFIQLQLQRRNNTATASTTSVSRLFMIPTKPTNTINTLNVQRRIMYHRPHRIRNSHTTADQRARRTLRHPCLNPPANSEVHHYRTNQSNVLHEAQNVRDRHLQFHLHQTIKIVAAQAVP